MWKNKHLIVALLVAPILALIAYFATDYIVAERPHAAVAGGSYPLVAKSNCRYESGECSLENGDVKLTLRPGPERDAGGRRLHLTSALALNEARVAVARDADDDVPPLAFAADDTSATSWSTDLGDFEPGEASLRLVVMAGESHYFAEVPTVFFDREDIRSR